MKFLAPIRIPFSTKSASFLQIGGHTQVPHPLKVIAGVRKGPPLPQPLGVLANRHGIDQSFVYCLFTSASKSPLSHRRTDTFSRSVLPSCRDVHGRGASATRWRCWPATSSWRIGSRRTVQKLIQQKKNRHDICQNITQPQLQPGLIIALPCPTVRTSLCICFADQFEVAQILLKMGFLSFQ